MQELVCTVSGEVMLAMEVVLALRRAVHGSADHILCTQFSIIIVVSRTDFNGFISLFN